MGKTRRRKENKQEAKEEDGGEASDVAAGFETRPSAHHGDAISFGLFSSFLSPCCHTGHSLMELIVFQPVNPGPTGGPGEPGTGLNEGDGEEEEVGRKRRWKKRRGRRRRMEGKEGGRRGGRGGGKRWCKRKTEREEVGGRGRRRKKG